MKSDTFSRSLMTILKRRAIARGLTQEALARQLNVSLPTVKRWLAGRAVTLETMRAIADAVGISLAEIASSMEETQKPLFQYSLEQEKHLAENPDCLAFFDHLIRGFSPVKIQKKFGLSTSMMEKYLGKLDKLKLIQWQPKNRVRLLCLGEPQWRKDGPLVRAFKTAVVATFMEQKSELFEKFFLHDYLPEDEEKIKRILQELAEESKHANARAAMAGHRSKSVGLFLSLKSFRWSLDGFLKG